MIAVNELYNMSYTLLEHVYVKSFQHFGHFFNGTVLYCSVNLVATLWTRHLFWMSDSVKDLFGLTAAVNQSSY